MILISRGYGRSVLPLLRVLLALPVPDRGMKRVHQSACSDESNYTGSPKRSPKHLHRDELETVTEASATGARLALFELAWQLVRVEARSVTPRLQLARTAHALEVGHIDVRGDTGNEGQRNG